MRKLNREVLLYLILILQLTIVGCTSKSKISDNYNCRGLASGSCFDATNDNVELLVENHLKEVKAERSSGAKPEAHLTEAELKAIVLEYIKKDPSIFIGATRQGASARFAYKMKKNVESVEDLPNDLNLQLNLLDSSRGDVSQPAYESGYMKNERGQYITFQMGTNDKGAPVADFYIPSRTSTLYNEVSIDKIDPALFNEISEYVKEKVPTLEMDRVVGVMNADVTFLFDAQKIFGDAEFVVKVSWGLASRKPEEPAVISLKLAQEYDSNEKLVLSSNPALGEHQILGPLKSADKLKMDSETGLPVNHVLIEGLTKEIKSELSE